MTTSTPIQTAIERPSIGHQTTSGVQATQVAPVVASLELAGMRCFVDRHGDHVTGRVEFPQQFNRQPMPIDYRSCPSRSSGVDDKLDAKTQAKLDAVKRYLHLIVANPKVKKLNLADRAAIGTKVKARSIQLWTRSYELHGVDGLRDKYVKPIKKLLVVDPAKAKEAMMICMWWSWRVGNIDVIDTPMMTRAVGLLDLAKPNGRSFTIDDVLKTIDSYYGYDTIRSLYPFKIFAKWAKYDFSKWYYIMVQSADVAASRTASRAAAKTRKRDTFSSISQSAIDRLSTTPKHPDAPSVPDHPEAHRHRPGLVADTDKFLRSIGFDHAADQVSAQPGSIMAEPAANLHAAMVKLDAVYRSMLLRAARGEAHAQKEASATFAMWWPDVACPQTRNIDRQVDQYADDHNLLPTHPSLQSRRCLMLYPLLLGKPRGHHRIFKAACQ